MKQEKVKTKRLVLTEGKDDVLLDFIENQSDPKTSLTHLVNLAVATYGDGDIVKILLDESINNKNLDSEVDYE